MKRIILITGNEQRHKFFRKYLSINSQIEVLAAYCETTKGNIIDLVKSDNYNELRLEHLIVREETEKDFFESYNDSHEDKNAIY